MSRMLPIAGQNFQTLRENNYFYIDKTKFIADWWREASSVTLITRPRRFGKSLTLDTVRTFFSLEFAGRSDLFQDLYVWQEEKLREVQGTIPVIFLSFANLNPNSFEELKADIKKVVTRAYDSFRKCIDRTKLSSYLLENLDEINESMSDVTTYDSLVNLCTLLKKHYNVKPIILLDDYSKPYQDARDKGYLKEFESFMDCFLTSTFKVNPDLDRALLTGIIHITNDSIFSGFNNVDVISSTSNFFKDDFGFTEQEVSSAMDEYHLSNKSEVKKWYGGFKIGDDNEMYNPWSIVNLLSTKKLDIYWEDTQLKVLLDDLFTHAGHNLKKRLEPLLRDESISAVLDEQILFSRLYAGRDSILSFLMAYGLFQPLECNFAERKYTLAITNFEAKRIIEKTIATWFDAPNNDNYHNLIKALLEDNLDDMNVFMSKLLESYLNHFYTKLNYKTDDEDIENFYHCLVLSLIIHLKDRYSIVSNPDSRYLTYDICMSPKEPSNHYILLQFNTARISNYEDDEDHKHNQNKKQKKKYTATEILETECAIALKKIHEHKYIDDLIAKNIDEKNIYVYGVAFLEKNVLICGGAEQQIDWQRIMNVRNKKFDKYKSIFKK
ncbi:MAG: AAA family ATPase [Desulfovibrionaceae bacterium]|nr:AAA family ATPase [Desulfovibrionaceae bacterium]